MGNRLSSLLTIGASRPLEKAEDTIATSSDNQRPVFDVLVIGCGLSGLASVLALAQAGHRVTVFERSEKLQEEIILTLRYFQIGAGIQLAPNATRLLARWRVLDEVMKYADCPQEGSFWSYKGQKISRSLPVKDPGLVTADAPYVVAHRADILRALASGVAHDLAGTIEVKLSADVETIDFEKCEIHLVDGESYKGDLILASDGERSKSRAQFLGHVGLQSHPSFSDNDVVYRLAVPTGPIIAAGKSHPAYDLAIRSTVNLWMGPGGHVVEYHMQKDMLNVVLVYHEEEVCKPMIGPQQTELTEFKKKIEGWDTVLHSLLDVEGVVCTKWTLFQIVEPPSWTTGSFALIGDAAHAMLPCLAQGAAQAFEDAGVLGGIFSHPIRQDQIPAALRVFEEVRRPRASEVRYRTLTQKTMIGLPNGEEQEKRDAMLSDGGDYDTWKWLWSYDAAASGREAWSAFTRTGNPEEKDECQREITKTLRADGVCHRV
ncbi:hypothetical protein V8F20_012606 [Naviculisporaceae sp. PSN 640]